MLGWSDAAAPLAWSSWARLEGMRRSTLHHLATPGGGGSGDLTCAETLGQQQLWALCSATASIGAAGWAHPQQRLEGPSYIGKLWDVK